MWSHDLKQKQNFLAMFWKSQKNNTSVAKTIAWNSDLGSDQGSREKQVVAG